MSILGSPIGVELRAILRFRIGLEYQKIGDSQDYIKRRFSSFWVVILIMPTYDLGTLVIEDHNVKQLHQALDIPDHRIEDIINLARNAWDQENRISESIEYIARNVSGSELVLALIFFGRIWEDNQQDDE